MSLFCISLLVECNRKSPFAVNIIMVFGTFQGLPWLCICVADDKTSQNEWLHRRLFRQVFIINAHIYAFTFDFVVDWALAAGSRLSRIRQRLAFKLHLIANQYIEFRKCTLNAHGRDRWAWFKSSNAMPLSLSDYGILKITGLIESSKHRATDGIYLITDYLEFKWETLLNLEEIQISRNRRGTMMMMFTHNFQSKFRYVAIARLLEPKEPRTISVSRVSRRSRCNKKLLEPRKRFSSLLATT